MSEPTSIGLSERAHEALRLMKEEGHVAEMADGYRLAIGLALSRGIVPPEISGKRTTILSVATVDPDHEIASAIRALMDLGGSPVYRMAERLAEWGVHELTRQFSGGTIDVAALIGASPDGPGAGV